MPIELIPQSTDVAGGSNAQLLKALKERKQLQEMLAGGQGAKGRQEAAPAFQPSNAGQAAFGYAGVIANGIGDRMVIEREKKAQADRIGAAADALGAISPEFGKLPRATRIGLLLADPELPSKIAVKEHEVRNRKPDFHTVGQDQSLIRTDSRPGAMPGAAPMPAGPAAPPMTGRAPAQSSLPPGTDVVFQGRPKQTEAQKAVDQGFGKDYADFIAGGGYAQAQSDLAQMKGLASTLKKPPHNYSGPVIGMMPDAVAGFVAPKALDFRDRVGAIVQQNLKNVLGAQFTEKEGQRLTDRAYNPRLDEAENQKRLERLSIAMEGALNAKADAAAYFEANNTMDGYKGSVPLRNVDPLIKAMEAPDPPAGSAAPAAEAPRIKRYNLETGMIE